MIVTSALITTAANFIVKEIIKSKGYKQATDEISTGLWNRVKPLFLGKEKKLVEKLEESPEKYKAALELKVEEMAEEDESFANQLKEWVEKHASSELKVEDIKAKGDIVVKADQIESKAEFKDFKSDEGKITIDIKQK